VAATDAFRRDFTLALNDDLNSPRALAALFGLARDANRELDAGSAVGDNLLSCITLAEQVLDVFPTGSTRLTGQSSGDAELAEVAPSDREARAAWAVGWAGRRFQARLARDYAEADRIRAMLEAEGFEVRDTRDGVEVVAR
jgi:cysteinyl-tRNA synthetase